MLPIKATLPAKGISLDAYPHADDTTKWVLNGAILHGEGNAHILVPADALDAAFPPEGIRLTAEQNPETKDWTFTLHYNDRPDPVSQEVFTEDTSIFTAMKSFFTLPLMIALGPRLNDLMTVLRGQ